MLITRKMDEADAAAVKSDGFAQKAQAYHEKWMRTDTILRTLPVLFMLCLLPLLPFYTDPPVETWAIGELMTNHNAPSAPVSSLRKEITSVVGLVTGNESPPQDPPDTEPSTLQVIYVVFGQTALVLFVSFFGKPDDESASTFSAMVLRGIGLLVALAVPCIALSTIIAQANTAAMQSSVPMSWGQALGQNAHFIGFCIFSLAAHCAIWAKAPEIPSAFLDLPKAIHQRALLAKKHSSESASKAWTIRCERIVVKAITHDERRAEEEKPAGKEAEFKYITSHLTVAALIEKHTKKEYIASHPKVMALIEQPANKE